MAKGRSNGGEITTPIAEAHRERAETYVDAYANLCEIAQSAWDLQIKFSRIVLRKPGEPGIEEQAAVVMTYAQAKALATLLTRQIAEYESTNGEIKVPGAATATKGKAK